MSKPFGYADMPNDIADVWLEIRRDSMPQVDALINAGWLFEPVTENSEPWQWAWRRPKRRKGSKGMRFASTNQAYRALMKEKNL